jgi:hypothetical protein
MPTSSSSRPGRRPDPSLRARWQQHCERFEQSGLTASAFCARHGLSLPSFYAWRRRLRGHGPTSAQPQLGPRFVPIRLGPAAAATPVELVLPQGAVLRLSPGCDLDLVRCLVESLGGASC